MIKAIETVYNGYRFRSRLEARWAVFFDAIGIRYIYENEGFEKTFGDGETLRYLPDFYLPDFDLYAEVKGVDHRGQISKQDAIKMSWMIDFCGPCKNGIILLGNLPDPKGATGIWWAIWRWMGKGLEYGYVCGDTPAGYSWDLWRVEFCESAPYFFEDDLMVTHGDYKQDYEGNPPKYPTRIEKALTKARQARFEHGETPHPQKTNIIKCPLHEYVFDCIGCTHEHNQMCDFGVRLSWSGDGSVGLCPEYQ